MRPPINHARLNDRASAVATAVLQIAQDAKLRPFELRFRVEQYLRDEIADIKRQIANDREINDET